MGVIKKKYITTIIIVIITIIIGVGLWWHFGRTKLIPENKDTLKFKLQPSVFQNKNLDTEFLFEPDDLDYYNETPLPLYEQINFTINDYDLNENPIPRVEIPEIDRQNVHDGTVNKYIRRIFSDFGVEDENKNVVDEIKQGIVTRNPEKRQKIIKVLNEIKSRNANITNLGNVSELIVLNTVWQNAKGNDNIKDMMYQQLIDSIENDNVVCPTGVVTRLTTALSVETPENLPKTKEHLNAEMLNKASHIRNQLEQNENYNELDDPSQLTEFRSTLVSTLETDYRDILTKNEIQEIINPWIDYI